MSSSPDPDDLGWRAHQYLQHRLSVSVDPWRQNTAAAKRIDWLLKTAGRACMVGPWRHVLATEGYSPQAAEALIDFIDALDRFLDVTDGILPLIPRTTCVNLFVENSTRTAASFTIAAQRLAADVVALNIQTSSLNKGETILDTALTINAMTPTVLIVRHAAAGTAQLLANKVRCGVINAGDGGHEHPTQALIDATVMRRHLGTLKGKVVAICGDILHSRVARSNLHLLRALGMQVRFVAPPTLLPSDPDVPCLTSMEEGLQGVDVIMMLRLQRERTTTALIPSTHEFFRFFGLTRERLKIANPSAIVMHPGPMNRGVEIDSDVADDDHVSVIQEQVRTSVAVRMACIALVASTHIALNNPASFHRCQEAAS